MAAVPPLWPVCGLSIRSLAIVFWHASNVFVRLLGRLGCQWHLVQPLSRFWYHQRSFVVPLCCAVTGLANTPPPFNEPIATTYMIAGREPDYLLGKTKDIKQIEVLDLIHRLSRERGVTIIMAIHDINQAMAVCDRISLLNHGNHYVNCGLDDDLPDRRSLKH